MRRIDFSTFLGTSWPWLVGLAVALLVLGGVIVWLRSRLVENSDAAASTGDLLLEYTEMVRRGELTEEEFRLIRSRMRGGTPPAVSPGPPAEENGVSSPGQSIN